MMEGCHRPFGIVAIDIDKAGRTTEAMVRLAVDLANQA